LLRFGGIVEVVPGVRPSTMLGGTGLAISSACKTPEIAANYARFVAAPSTQSGLFYQNGGQPGHRTAWLGGEVNASCSNFFADTLPTLDQAFVRPRYAGYLAFQDHAGDPIHEYLRLGGEPRKVLAILNRLYRESCAA
jgi:multiple sugar transport system substrate-binding protein